MLERKNLYLQALFVQVKLLFKQFCLAYRYVIVSCCDVSDVGSRCESFRNADTQLWFNEDRIDEVATHCDSKHGGARASRCSPVNRSHAQLQDRK